MRISAVRRIFGGGRKKPRTQSKSARPSPVRGSAISPPRQYGTPEGQTSFSGQLRGLGGEPGQMIFPFQELQYSKVVAPNVMESIHDIPLVRTEAEIQAMKAGTLPNPANTNPELYRVHGRERQLLLDPKQRGARQQLASLRSGAVGAPEGPGGNWSPRQAEMIARSREVLATAPSPAGLQPGSMVDITADIADKTSGYGQGSVRQAVLGRGKGGTRVPMRTPQTPGQAVDIPGATVERKHRQQGLENWGEELVEELDPISGEMVKRPRDVGGATPHMLRKIPGVRLGREGWEYEKLKGTAESQKETIPGTDIVRLGETDPKIGRIPLRDRPIMMQDPKGSLQAPEVQLPLPGAVQGGFGKAVSGVPVETSDDIAARTQVRGRVTDQFVDDDVQTDMLALSDTTSPRSRNITDMAGRPVTVRVGQGGGDTQLPDTPLVVKIPGRKKPVEAFPAVSAADELHVYTILGLRLGLRREVEAADLLRGDIDFEKNVLYITKGKNQARRTVPLDGIPEEELRRIHDFYLKTSEDPTLALRRGGKDKLFLTNKKTLNDRWRKLAQIANKGKPISYHNLRHIAAINAWRKGATLRDLQVWLGHADIKETKSYLGNAVQEAYKAEEALNPQLFRSIAEGGKKGELQANQLTHAETIFNYVHPRSITEPSAFRNVKQDNQLVAFGRQVPVTYEPGSYQNVARQSRSGSVEHADPGSMYRMIILDREQKNVDLAKINQPAVQEMEVALTDELHALVGAAHRDTDIENLQGIRQRMHSALVSYVNRAIYPVGPSPHKAQVLEGITPHKGSLKRSTRRGSPGAFLQPSAAGMKKDPFFSAWKIGARPNNMGLLVDDVFEQLEPVEVTVALRTIAREMALLGERGDLSMFSAEDIKAAVAYLGITERNVISFDVINSKFATGGGGQRQRITTESTKAQLGAYAGEEKDIKRGISLMEKARRGLERSTGEAPTHNVYNRFAAAFLDQAQGKEQALQKFFAENHDQYHLSQLIDISKHLAFIAATYLTSQGVES